MSGILKEKKGVRQNKEERSKIKTSKSEKKEEEEKSQEKKKEKARGWIFHVRGLVFPYKSLLSSSLSHTI